MKVLGKLGISSAQSRQIADSYFAAPLAPYRTLAMGELQLRPAFPSTSFSFDIGAAAVIPVGRMELEAQKSAAVAQQQLQNDVQTLERYNAPIKELNDRVLPILKEVAGSDLGDSQETWQRWWVDQIGFTIMPQRASDKPTIIENIPLAYQPQPVPISTITGPVGFRAHELLRRRDSGSYAFRGPSDRDPQRRGSRPHAKHHHRALSVTSRSWSSTATRRVPPTASPWGARRSSAATSTAFGRRARGGSWHAT